MSKYDIAYAVGGLLLIGFELYAVYMRGRTGIKETITHKVVAWIARKPGTRRVLVGIGLAWLAWHWLVQPTEY